MTSKAALGDAIQALADFAHAQPTTRIREIEDALLGTEGANTAERVLSLGVSDTTLEAAILVKEAAGQIDTLLHALGMLNSLPYLLAPRERILSMSLGAGNTGKSYDLETDAQVAEFKFIRWRGHDSIRQDQLFKDLVTLLEDESGRIRNLYVVDDRLPKKFLTQGRAIQSVLGKHQSVYNRFRERYGEGYATVGEFFRDVHDLVNIVDLRNIVPTFSEA